MKNILASLSLREKIILGSIIALTIFIPLTSFVIANRFRAQTVSNASTDFDRNISFSPPSDVTEATVSAQDELKKSSEQQARAQSGTSTPSPTPEEQTLDVSFGPTLKFILRIDARPTDKQAVSLFLGIASGNLSQNPQYLLTFTVPVPDTGVYTGISLAGLSVGGNYTAYLKGPGQIATSAAFTVAPTVTDLGIANLLSGDLNEDNVINSADYGIAGSLYGTTPSSTNWNPNADFNEDGIVNAYDLGYILRNFGQTGAGSAWVSTPTGSSQAQITSPSIGGTASDSASSSGHWLWVPKY